MNRRGFISLLGGLAAAPLVPWRLDVTRRIILPPMFPLVAISGMQIRQLSVPQDWIEGPIHVNSDYAFIRSDRLQLLEANYRQLVEFVDVRTRSSIITRLR